MTSNQIERAKVEETKRSNREKEKLERRKQNIGIVTSLGRGIKDAFTKFNDPSWYNEDPQLSKDVASIPFNNPLGSKFGFEFGETRAPGVYVISWMPTIGNNKGGLESSIANTAAKNIYAYVRHANSGSRNYESADLMQYLLAMDSCYSFWAAMRRAYSLALTTKGHNRYYNDAMLYSLGFDAASIRNNLANFRSLINSFATRVNSFYVPNVMPYYLRHQWLNTVIVKDSPVKKSQVYMYVQKAYYHYDNVNAILSTVAPDSKTEHGLEFYPGANHTYSEIAEFANYMVNNLMEIEDIGIMSGDILKAYGENNLYFLPSTDENFHIESEYSEEILSQIQNTVLVGQITLAEFDIKQDDNSRLYQGRAFYAPNSQLVLGYGLPTSLGQSNLDTITGYTKGQSYVLNMYKDDPSVDDVMVATRNMVGYVADKCSAPSDTNIKYFIDTYGSEVCLDGTIVSLNENGEPRNLTTVQFITMFTAANAIAATYGIVSKFDWAPNVFIVAPGVDDSLVYDQTQDWANYTTLNKDNIANLHYAAVLSEFGVPKLGITVRTR